MRYGKYWRVTSALAGDEKVESSHTTSRAAYAALGARAGLVVCLPTIEHDEAPSAPDCAPFEASRWCVVVRKP